MDYGDDDSVVDQDRVFVVAHYWRTVLERFDEEGFGEVPLFVLEDLVKDEALNVGAEDDWDVKSLLKAKLERLKDERQENVAIQEIVDAASRKRSYSFRKAVSSKEEGEEENLVGSRTRANMTSTSEAEIRRGRSCSSLARRDKIRRKIWRLLTSSTSEEEQHYLDAVKNAEEGGDDGEVVDTASRSLNIPWLTCALASVLLFFAIFHWDFRDWKSRLLLPCHDSEPWRYLITSLIPLDHWEFVFFFLAHLASLLPLELRVGTARASFLYFMGVFTCSVLSIFVDCRSSQLRGHGGTTSAAFSLLLYAILSNSNNDNNSTLHSMTRPHNLAPLCYLSMEAGLSLYESFSSSWSVCHCHLSGAISAAAFANILMSATSIPLRENRLFLSTLLVYFVIGVIVVLVAALTQVQSGCVFFRKVQVNL